MTPKDRRGRRPEIHTPPHAGPKPSPTAAQVEEWKRWAAGKDRVWAWFGRRCLADFAGIEVPPDSSETVPGVRSCRIRG